MNNAPIGILDSGAGGITIWAEIVSTMPAESTVYWADSAHCPYGGRTQGEIIALTDAGVRTLMAEGCKTIVVACNTATTAAIGVLRERYPGMSFVGLEPAIKPAAEGTRSGVVGVLATKATIESEMFRNTTGKFARGIRVLAVAGEGLVDLVEDELELGPEAEQLLEKYIGPMIEAGADHLVLACTHYPMLMHAIRKVSRGRLTIINPAGAVARHTARLLAASGLEASRDHVSEYRFLSTAGDAAAERLRVRARKYLDQLAGESDPGRGLAD